MKRGGSDIVCRLSDGGSVEAFYTNDIGEDCWTVVHYDSNHFQLDYEACTFYTKAEAKREVMRQVKQYEGGN